MLRLTSREMGGYHWPHRKALRFFAEVQAGVGNLRSAADPAEPGPAGEPIDAALPRAAFAMGQLIRKGLTHNSRDHTTMQQRNSKHQIANPKQIQNSKHQGPKRRAGPGRFGIWGFGLWNLFGI